MMSCPTGRAEANMHERPEGIVGVLERLSWTRAPLVICPMCRHTFNAPADNMTATICINCGAQLERAGYDEETIRTWKWRRKQ